MNSISPLTSEISAVDAVPSAFSSTSVWDVMCEIEGKNFKKFLKNKRIIKKLCSDIYFTKKVYPNIGIPCPVVQSKVEKNCNTIFILGQWWGNLGHRAISGTFGHNQVFLGIFTIGMNKLH